MPVKRRATKRKITPEAELAAWSDFFSFGINWFPEVEALGYVEPTRIPVGPEREKARSANLELAREVWRRLGERFLAEFQPTPEQPVAWAIEQFGRPPTCQ